MGLHGTQSSLCALALCCVLLSVLLTTVRTFPTLRTDTLLCYFCPLQHKSESCRKDSTTYCIPDEVCAISRGFKDGEHVLTAQGCVKRHLCGSHEVKFHFGVSYNVSFTCCCKNTCNSRVKLEPSLKVLLGMVQTVKPGVDVSLTQPFDSCANYTAPPMFRSGK